MRRTLVYNQSIHITDRMQTVFSRLVVLTHNVKRLILQPQRQSSLIKCNNW